MASLPPVPSGLLQLISPSKARSAVAQKKKKKPRRQQRLINERETNKDGRHQKAQPTGSCGLPLNAKQQTHSGETLLLLKLDSATESEHAAHIWAPLGCIRSNSQTDRSFVEEKLGISDSSCS